MYDCSHRNEAYAMLTVRTRRREGLFIQDCPAWKYCDIINVSRPIAVRAWKEDVDRWLSTFVLSRMLSLVCLECEHLVDGEKLATSVLGTWDQTRRSLSSVCLIGFAHSASSQLRRVKKCRSEWGFLMLWRLILLICVSDIDFLLINWGDQLSRSLW